MTGGILLFLHDEVGRIGIDSEVGMIGIDSDMEKVSLGITTGELLGVTPGMERGTFRSLRMLLLFSKENIFFMEVGGFGEWITSTTTACMRSLIDSNSSIVFSIVAMKDFFRSRVIFACILLRSRLIL